MARKIENYIPVVKYDGLNTDKAVVFGSTLAVTGAITATGGVTGAVTGAVAATTITASSTLDVTGASTLAGAVNYKKQVTTTGGAFATPIALTEAQSGRTILADTAAGLDFTLPAVAAAQIGTHYEFLFTTTITSNSLRFTAQSGDLLRGGISIQDFDTANTIAYFTPDESDDLIMSCNGSTTGGKKGSVIRITAITATGWFVEGRLFGDGTLATPFS